MAWAGSDDALHVHSLGVLNVFVIYPGNNTQWKHGVEWLTGKAHSLGHFHWACVMHNSKPLEEYLAS